MHVLAVDVLSLCLVEEGGMEALHSSDCLQRLLESIHNSQLPQMKTKAVNKPSLSINLKPCVQMFISIYPFTSLFIH